MLEEVKTAAGKVNGHLRQAEGPTLPGRQSSSHGATVWPGPIYRESLRTWANGLTLTRTLVCLVVFTYALTTRSYAWNLVGLAVYWSLDMLDGFLARTLNQETVFGAQFDIQADRFLIAFFYLNYVTFRPEMTLVVAVFLMQFMVLDCYLSNQFMRWPIRSPNYFYEVDRTIWRLNWSPLGKFANTGLFTVLLLATGSALVVWPVAVALVGVKLYSVARLHQLVPK